MPARLSPSAHDWSRIKSGARSRKEARIIRRGRPWIVVFGLGVAVTAGDSRPADAATLRVPADHPTIRVAVDAASSGDVVLVAPGTYSGVETRAGATSLIFLKGGVSIVSEAGPEVTILDGSDPRVVEYRSVLFGFSLPEPVLLEGFTITGECRGITIYEGAGLNVRNCAFVDLYTTADEWGEGAAGGGIYAPRVPVTVFGSRFSLCRADVGAAIWVGRESLVMEDCFVGACTASRGSAVETHHSYDDPFRFFRIERCVFRNNVGWVAAGALRTSIQGYRSVLRDCVFEGNRSGEQWGSGAMSGGGFEFTMERNLFVRNIAQTGAGGAEIYGHNIVVANNTFVGNLRESTASIGSALEVRGNVHFFANLFVENGPTAAVTGFDTWFFRNECNVYWNNPGGNVSGMPAGTGDRTVDPVFCDAASDDYTLSTLSPCLPANSPGCGLVGAFGQGCGTVSVERQSWAKVKALYR